MKALVVLCMMGVCGMAGFAQAYEAAYPKTANGVMEIKTIPSAKLMVAEGPGGYFDSSNDLFMRLFRYISANDVSMTVPVEARIDKAEMKFYVGSGDSAKKLADSDAVRVVSLPARTVASIGIRGRYTRASFEKNRDKLAAWLRKSTCYRPAGEAYAVYWDGPFMLWFLKHSEVHIPVAEIKK